MKRPVLRLAPAVAAVLLLALPSGAGRADVGIVIGTPRPVGGGAADERPFVGLACGLAASSDPLQPFGQNGTTMAGVVTAGPWAVPDPTTYWVYLRCAVQTNSADPHAPESPTVRRTSRSSSWPGGVGALLDTVVYDRYPNDAVYVCTTAMWSAGDGVHTYHHDAEPAVAGVQCAPTISVRG